MWNQVGNPSMLEGKTFLPLHGIPIPCRARSRTRLADWLPDPLTVPTRIARSLTEGCVGAAPSPAARGCLAETTVDMNLCLAVAGTTAEASASTGKTHPTPPATPAETSRTGMGP